MPFRPLEISRIYLIGIVSHIDTYTCLLASNEWNDLVIEFTGVALCRSVDLVYKVWTLMAYCFPFSNFSFCGEHRERMKHANSLLNKSKTNASNISI